MGTIKLDEKSLRNMMTFQSITRVDVFDIGEDEENIIFVIYPGTLRKAIMHNGENVKRVKEKLNKNIIIVEFSPDLKRFVYNLFYRFGVKEIEMNEIEGSYSIAVKVDPAQKARAIGKEGRNLRLTRDLLKRHFNVSSLLVK